MKGLIAGRIVVVTTLAGTKAVGLVVNAAPKLVEQDVPEGATPREFDAADGVVNLIVLHDRGVEPIEYAQAVPYDEDGAPGTWCWPTRDEAE